MISSRIRAVFSRVLMFVALGSGVANADLYCAGKPDPCGPVQDNICNDTNTPDCGTDHVFPCCLRGFNQSVSDIMHQTFDPVVDTTTVVTTTTGVIITEEYFNGTLIAQNVFGITVPNEPLNVNLSELAPTSDFFRIYVGQRPIGPSVKPKTFFGPSMFHVLASPQNGSRKGQVAVQEVIRLNPDPLSTPAPPVR